MLLPERYSMQRRSTPDQESCLSMTFRARIQNFLSARITGRAILILAILTRIINVLLVSYAGRDKMLLVLQSKNLLQGHGPGVPRFFTDQLEHPVFDYTQLWPPGYSITLAPFLKLFNYDVYWATTSLDILVSVALILIIRRISRQLLFPAIAVNLMTLLAGCFDYSFINESLPTDTISLLFFLIAFSYLIRNLSADRFSFRRQIVTALLLFLPCLYRFAFPPVVIAIPAVLTAFSWLKKDHLRLKKGVVITVVLVILLVTYYILLKSLTGQAGYITPTERGFFLKNIVHWYPVIPASFIDLPFLTSQLILYTRLDFNQIMRLLEAVNILAAVFLSVTLFIHFFRVYKMKSADRGNQLLLLGMAAVLVNCLLLGYLSLTYEVQKGAVNDWNYITEARYFSLAYLFVQFLFTGYYFLGHAWKKRLWKRVLMVGCLLLLSIEVVHSLYFHVKVAFRFEQYKSSVFREQDYNFFNSLLEELPEDYPGREILVAAPGDNFYPYTAAYQGEKGIFDPQNLVSGLPRVHKKSVLVVMLYDQELEPYRQFTNDKRVKKVKRIAYSNFFLTELNP